MWKKLVIIVLGVVTGLPVAGFAGTAEDAGAHKAAALEILAEEVGSWASRWEWLGPNGEIAGIQEGVENYEAFIPDSVFLNTNIMSDPPAVSKSITFYNPVRDKIFFISVGQDGDHWILSRDVGSDVLISEPHPLPGGKILTIRFTTMEKTADSRKILMERSWDDGETWEAGFYQYMTRTSGASETSDQEGVY